MDNVGGRKYKKKRWQKYKNTKRWQKYKNTKRWQKDTNTKRWQKDKKVLQRAQVNNGQVQIEFGRCIPSTTLLAILIKFASFAKFARFTHIWAKSYSCSTRPLHGPYDLDQLYLFSSNWMQGYIISDLDHLLLQSIPAYLYLYIAMQLIFDLHYFVLVTAFGGGCVGRVRPNLEGMIMAQFGSIIAQLNLTNRVIRCPTKSYQSGQSLPN